MLYIIDSISTYPHTHKPLSQTIPRLSSAQTANFFYHIDSILVKTQECTYDTYQSPNLSKINAEFHFT